MMQFKAGVKVTGVKPELALGLNVMHYIFEKFDIPMVITSIMDGKHGRGSLHYKGYAVDLRSKHISSNRTKQAILLEAKVSLGENYDLILEGEGTPNAHYHLEFDPK